jgi:hypothetical protein
LFLLPEAVNLLLTRQRRISSLGQTMKLFFAILLLMIGVCVACASRPTASQTPQSPQNQPSVPVPSPTPTANAAVSNQGPCSLVVDQAPVLNGLRLGMTPDEVLAVFPGSKDDAEIRAALSKPAGEFGVSDFRINPDKYGSKDKFVGIRQITFTLLDGRVGTLSIKYNGPEWPNVDKFVAKFQEGTNLPPVDAWEAYVGMETQMKTLKCKDFEVQIFAGGPGGSLNSVLVNDLAAAKKLEERVDKADKKAKP